MPMLRLVAFLGNPGRQYADTRHNIAWKLADELPFRAELSWREKFNGLAADWKSVDVNTTLLCPQTYMNRSGDSVAAAARFYKLDVDELLVVHDDLELPFGTLALKHGGGLGGHNGLTSLKQRLGSAAFWRFRLGIGRPQRGSVSSYVLSRFDDAESAELPRFLDDAARYLERVIREGPERYTKELQKRRILRPDSS
jgi:PTH1 family peptidyl-tRNA hydrolase